MFLKKVIYVNWGNIPQLEFEFGPINLFSGGNGSGKTTAADGIQTLMTAAHENLFNYNPGQDETTQRGRGGKQVRTLASYVLGCDDGSYARTKMTDAYLAGVFHPTQGEKGLPFTAIMAMRAHLDSAGTQRQARLDHLSFIILPEHEITLDHLVRTYPQSKYVVPTTEIAELLKMDFGKKAVEQYDKKGAYLRRMYGALRGKDDAVSDREAKHAAHAFSSFMAYKPVRSINDFVADEILEKKDLGEAIRTVSDLMKTIYGMEEDARHIIESIQILDKASGLSEQYVGKWTDRLVYRYQEAQRAYKVQQKAYVTKKQQQKQLTADIQEKESRLEVNQQRRDETHQSMVELEARRQGIAVLNEKDQLEKQIDRFENQLADQARPLLEQDHQLKVNAKAAQALLKQLAEHSWAVDIPELDEKRFRDLTKSLAHKTEEQGIDLHRLMGKDWVDISPLEQQLDQTIEAEQLHNQWVDLVLGETEQGGNLRDKIAELKSEFERQGAQKQRALQQKEKEIVGLESHNVTYPPYVEAAVHAIHLQCPNADPRVLCDYVEVLDPHWQMAIEGYLGGARFSILVAPEYEAEAIRIVRSMPGSRNRARVIQGSKAQRDADRLSLPGDSIVNIMKFEHKTAEYYLKASYGMVVQVPDAEALRMTPRGITKEGMASGNYSMWRCDLPDSDLVFGQQARERALAAKQKEYAELLIAAQKVSEQAQSLKSLFDVVNKIKGVSHARIIQSMVDIHRQLKRAEQALSQLDLSDFKQMEADLNRLREQFSALERELKTLENEKGRSEQALHETKLKVDQLAMAQEKLQAYAEQQEKSVREIAQLHSTFDADVELEKADEQLNIGEHDFYIQEIKAVGASLDKVSAELVNIIASHNQHCSPADVIVYDPDFDQLHEAGFFKRICTLQAEVGLIHNRLKNNVLVEKHGNLSVLRDRFNETFVSHLCHNIYQAINDGERALKELNRELEHHRFGTDQERFYFDWDWVPEYKEYWRFFKEVSKLPNLGDGASLFDMELPKAIRGVREKLVSMLLDDDEQKAFRELQRIADYRHYRRYDIFKEPLGKAPIPLSQYGTGSGGQLETPAYIIRSAAITSAFRFNEGTNHLRMVLVDEAFSKMDETRSREVINYLTETLGLQLLFIMPTSKSGPFMDLISNQFVFSKCASKQPVGELNTRVLVDRKACNQERIQDLWAQHRASIREQSMLDFMEDIV